MKVLIIVLVFLSFNVFAKQPQNCKIPNGFKKVNYLKQLKNKEFFALNKAEVKIKLSKKVTLINFWASWCVPCRKELPLLSNLSNSLTGKNYDIKVINLADSEQEKNTVLQKLNIKNLSNVYLKDYLILEQLNLTGLPATVVQTNTKSFVAIGILKNKIEDLDIWLKCLNDF